MKKSDLLEASMNIAKKLTKEEIGAVEMSNAHEYGFRVGAQRAAYLLLNTIEPYISDHFMERIAKEAEEDAN